MAPLLRAQALPKSQHRTPERGEGDGGGGQITAKANSDKKDFQYERRTIANSEIDHQQTGACFFARDALALLYKLLTMGKQGGIARFLGSWGGINGYVDDGKALWRHRSSLNKKKWKTMPTMAGQREAAKLFGAASVIAGSLWSGLPPAMRRLADGGAFNRLVGHCRVLMDSDGQLGDVEGLRNLDLNIEAMGNHGIQCESRWLSGEDGFRLVGMDRLMRDLDESLGASAGRKSKKFIVANRFIEDGICRESVDWKKLGGSRVQTERLSVKQIHDIEQLEMEAWKLSCNGGVKPRPNFDEIRAKRERRKFLGGDGKFVAISSRPQRRVRVWVHATQVATTEWIESMECYGLSDDNEFYSHGFVTRWMQHPRIQGFGGARGEWASSYVVEPASWRQPEMENGAYVVFTALEVSEKRGRHWVRLPWCCKMRVSDVVLVDSDSPEGHQEEIESRDQPSAIETAGSHEQGAGEPVLVPVPRRIEERISRRELGAKDVANGFIAWDFAGEFVGELKTSSRIVLSIMSKFAPQDLVLEGMRSGP